MLYHSLRYDARPAAPGLRRADCLLWRSRPSVHGDLVAWHRVTVDFPGPATSEDADANPFRDYRLSILFRNEDTGNTVEVPGFYATDGNAAETSATEGPIWRAHFLPSEPGAWQFTA